MPDGSDPGRAERYAEREVERIRRQVPEPNRTDIIHTIRKGRRGNIPSPKPRQDTKDAWTHRTVQNNARKIRDLAGALTGLKEAEYDGTTWEARPPRDGDYPDRLVDHTPEQAMNLVADMAIDHDWSEAYERDFLLTVRNHFLAHDRVDAAQLADKDDPHNLFERGDRVIFDDSATVLETREDGVVVELDEQGVLTGDDDGFGARKLEVVGESVIALWEVVDEDAVDDDDGMLCKPVRVQVAFLNSIDRLDGK